MKLEIVSGNKEDYGLGTFVLTLKEFGMKEYHPFLATMEWESVGIDLTDETPRGIIRQLVKSSRVIPRFDRHGVSRNVMLLLAEIAEDDSARIRSTFAKGGQSFEETLDMLFEKYRW